MSLGAELLLVLGLPLLLLVALTLWLSERGHNLPPSLAWLVGRRGTLWVSYILLFATILLTRMLLSRR